jgi:mono/diheme cytochrome c family protein
VLLRLGVLSVPWDQHETAWRDRWAKVIEPIMKKIPRGSGPALSTIPQVALAKSAARKAADDLKRLLRESKLLEGLLPNSPTDYPRLVDPYDDREDLAARVRSYLHANCSQCHVVAGGGNSQINLDFATDLAGTKLIDVLPQHKNFAPPGTPLIKPGDPDHSILYQRATRRGTGQMPPLATSLVDRRAAKLLRQWISGLPEQTSERSSDPPLKSGQPMPCGTHLEPIPKPGGRGSRRAVRPRKLSTTFGFWDRLYDDRPCDGSSYGEPQEEYKTTC